MYFCKKYIEIYNDEETDYIIMLFDGRFIWACTDRKYLWKNCDGNFL